MQYLLRTTLPETPMIRALNCVRDARNGFLSPLLGAKAYKLVAVAEDASGQCQPADIVCSDGPGREVPFQ